MLIDSSPWQRRAGKTPAYNQLPEEARLPVPHTETEAVQSSRLAILEEWTILFSLSSEFTQTAYFLSRVQSYTSPFQNTHTENIDCLPFKVALCLGKWITYNLNERLGHSYQICLIFLSYLCSRQLLQMLPTPCCLRWLCFRNLKPRTSRKSDECFPYTWRIDSKQSCNILTP